MAHRIITHNMPVSMPNGLITALVRLDISHDPRWGADADGNRGISSYDIEACEIVRLMDANEAGVASSPEIEAAVELAIDKLSGTDIMNMYHEKEEE